jgi:hypothetical protein
MRWHTLAGCVVPDWERMRATAAMAARYGCVYVEPFASATLEAEAARRRENALPVVVRFSQAPLHSAGSAQHAIVYAG